MRIGIVGGGVLGLTLGYRLSQRGHAVEVFEAEPSLGGLSTSHDYGPFSWDRFYHCILPTDAHLIGLLDDLGLGAELRWGPTGTGYYGGGRFFAMNTVADYLRFSLLSWPDKARLGASVLYATRLADPWALYGITARDWLSRICGRRGYEAFWEPLLKAKYGPYHDQVAAVVIWATLKRLTGARSSVGTKEQLGYVRGGYGRILGRLRERLLERQARVHVGAPVSSIRPSRPAGGPGPGCEIIYRAGGEEHRAGFDQVFFTGPTPVARRVVGEAWLGQVERIARENPTSRAYLGVACMVLALRRPLTPYYVLNVADERVELTGVVEMTNLVDRHAETAGLSLIYVPRYLDSADPLIDADDAVISNSLMDRGLKRLFPELRTQDLVYQGIHRARYVQPLPLVRDQAASPGGPRPLERPFHVLNTSMLTCATLNNNEVVGLVDAFLARTGGALR